MQLIVVADIYGKTRCLEQLVHAISAQYSLVEIVDPYDGKELDFRCESQAYDHFQKSLGLDGYIDKLWRKLQGKEQEVLVLLGFSIGASAVWAVSGKLKNSPHTKGICFYSSQIRNYLNIQPEGAMDIYFAQKERFYDVDTISSELSNTANVTCYKTEYLHGFMNNKSLNFDKQGYDNYIEILRKY